MALSVGENSYIDVEDADAYFDDHLDGDVWTALTPERKAQALVTATRDIDRRAFLGKRASEDQSLAFPRAVMTGCGWRADDVVPPAVSEAVCEQALFRVQMIGYDRERRVQHTLGVIGGSVGSANEYSDSTLVRQNRARSPLCPEAVELLREWTAGSVAIR